MDRARATVDLADDVVRLPEKAAFDKKWRSMTWGQRREVLRTVGRGQAMRKRSDARLAVMAARQQQRYWKWAWVIGPVVSLMLIPNWVAVVVNAAVISAVTGAFAFWKYRRATESEAANLDRLQR